MFVGPNGPLVWVTVPSSIGRLPGCRSSCWCRDLWTAYGRDVHDDVSPRVYPIHLCSLCVFSLPSYTLSQSSDVVRCVCTCKACVVVLLTRSLNVLSTLDRAAWDLKSRYLFGKGWILVTMTPSYPAWILMCEIMFWTRTLGWHWITDTL